MKTCNEFAPLLSAFFDGELTWDERAEMADHLSGCESCRARLDELAAMHAVLVELGEEEVPEGFTANVMAAVRAEKAGAAKMEKKKTKRAGTRRYLSLAACAALVVWGAATLPQFRMGSLTADSAAPESAEMQNGAAAYTAGDPTSEMAAGDEIADGEFPEQRYETVQKSAYQDALADTKEDAADGGAMSVSAQGAERAAEDGLVYSCEMREINGEEGLLWVDENGAVLLTLYGESATEYVEENGGVADGAGYYYLPVSALLALPEGIALRDAQAAALAELPEEAEWVLVYPDDFNEVPQR